MPLFLLSGLPGSGKTTFARALVARTAAVHVESDAVRRELFHSPRYTKDEHERVFAEVERRVATALASGQSVVLDATNLRAIHRARHLELADAGHGPVVAIRLVAPYRTLKERVSGGRDGHSQADAAVLRMMRGSEERFTRPTIVVDTRFDITPSVELALELAGVGP